jgi:hypothetical protein
LDGRVFYPRGPSRPAPIEVTFDDIVAVKGLLRSILGGARRTVVRTVDRPTSQLPVDDVLSPFPAPIECLDRFDTQGGLMLQIDLVDGTRLRYFACDFPDELLLMYERALHTDG